MRILGLTNSSMLVALLVGGIGKPFMGFAVSIIAGYVVGVFTDKLGRDKPPFYLVHALSAHMDHPYIVRYAPFLRRAAALAWTSRGLPPPPGVQSFYEP